MDEYTVVIRTLGKAGEKYQKLLESLTVQTIKPSAIIVYIAEGYAIPKETIGIERYIYVRKGMVAQRALSYDEVKTEYILFLDDDLYLPPHFVENMYRALKESNADVISPDVFPNDKRPCIGKIMMALSGRMIGRRDDGVWAYRVMRNGGYSYNNSPKKDIYFSQTNAGACFLCKKSDFLKINFQDEMWLDDMTYALGEDQVMFYKMYKHGLKILTLFHSGIQHLDGNTSISVDRERTIIYCDFRFKTIFCHRFIYLPDKVLLSRFLSILCICYTFILSFIISLMKGRWDILRLKYKAIKDGIRFIRSEEYKELSVI